MAVSGAAQANDFTINFYLYCVKYNKTFTHYVNYTSNVHFCNYFIKLNVDCGVVPLTKLSLFLFITKFQFLNTV